MKNIIKKYNEAIQGIADALVGPGLGTNNQMLTIDSHMFAVNRDGTISGLSDFKTKVVAIRDTKLVKTEIVGVNAPDNVHYAVDGDTLTIDKIEDNDGSSIDISITAEIESREFTFPLQLEFLKDESTSPNPETVEVPNKKAMKTLRKDHQKLVHRVKALEEVCSLVLTKAIERKSIHPEDAKIAMKIAGLEYFK